MCENEIDVGKNSQKTYIAYFNKNNPRSIGGFLNIERKLQNPLEKLREKSETLLKWNLNLIFVYSLVRQFKGSIKLIDKKIYSKIYPNW